MTLRNGRAASEQRSRGAHDSGMRPRFRLEDGLEERALFEIAAALEAEATPRAAFPRIVAAVHEALPLRAMVVVPRDERERSLVWSASRRDRAAAEAEVVGAAALAWLVAESEEEALSSALPSSRFAWITLPVVDGDARVLGLLAASTTAVPVSERHVAFVAAVARALSEPMSRAAATPSFFDEVRRDGEGIALRELASLLFDSLDYGATLGHVVRIVGGRVADGCVVLLDGKIGPERIAFAPALDDRAVDAALGGAFDAVRARGATVATAQHDPAALSAARRLGVDTLVACPIVNRGELLGTLAIFARGSTPRFDVGEVEELARRAAVAVENGRAYERALEALAERDRVLATVSHDLKNPLGVILLATSRALEGLCQADGGEVEKRSFETIRRSAHRMRKLVVDLLDVAAIEGRAMTMRPTL